MDKMEKKLNIVKFLHEERRKNEKLLNMHLFNYLTFLGIFLIDAIIIWSIKIRSIQTITLIGIISLIVLIGIEVYNIKKYTSECDDIDYFYLGAKKELRKK